MFWLSVDGEGFKRYPGWKRSLGVDRKGCVFVAAAVGGKEKEVSLSTLGSGAPALICFNHVYVSAAWMTDRFPQSRSHCHALVVHAKKHLQSEFRRGPRRVSQCESAVGRWHIKQSEDAISAFNALSRYLSVSEAAIMNPKGMGLGKKV